MYDFTPNSRLTWIGRSEIWARTGYEVIAFYQITIVALFPHHPAGYPDGQHVPGGRGAGIFFSE
jgi:hypothetical protein